MHSPHNRFAGVCAGILILSLLLAACTSPSPQAESAGLDLAATTWKLESVNGVAASTEAESAIFFGREGVLLGFTGCNVFSGSYQTSGNQISMPVDVVTPSTCTDALKLQEEALVQTITKASNAQRDGDKLTLSNPDNSLSAIFTLSAPADLAGTSWKLDSFNNGQGAFVSVIEGSEITAEFGSDGNLGGTAGCNSYTAAYTTEGSSISIGPAASTMMACAEPAGVMEQESQYLAALETASQYINLGAVLYLSDADNEPVALYMTAGQ